MLCVWFLILDTFRTLIFSEDTFKETFPFIEYFVYIWRHSFIVEFNLYRNLIVCFRSDSDLSNWIPKSLELAALQLSRNLFCCLRHSVFFSFFYSFVKIFPCFYGLYFKSLCWCFIFTLQPQLLICTCAFPQIVQFFIPSEFLSFLSVFIFLSFCSCNFRIQVHIYLRCQ